MADSWQVRTIESLCTQVTSGGTPRRMVDGYYVRPGEGTPWVKSKELRDSILTETEEWISDRALAESSAKLLPKDTILVAMYGGFPTVGKLGILAKPMACNQAVCALVVDPTEADYRYVFYRLQADRTRLESLANGAAQQNISGRLIRQFPVLVPALPEQRRIAGVLSGLDDLIETNAQVAARAIALAQLLAQRASEHVVTLGDLATLAETRTVMPLGPIDHYSLPAFDERALPERVDGADIKSNKTVIARDVVLVSRLNPHIPRIWAVYPKAGVTSVASTEFVPLRGLGVGVEEVFAIVSSDSYVAQLSSRVTGTTGSHQRVDKRGLFELHVPDVRRLTGIERQAIVALVREAHSARTACAELRSTREELLPLLMSGAVRVRPEGVAA